MNCPNCHRPNGEGLVNCDYCGTPLASDSPAIKRQTQAEAAAPPAGAPKRKTEIEAGAGAGGGFNPQDPFAPPDPRQAGGGFQPARRPAAPAAPSAKRKTEFDAGGGADFVPGAGGPPAENPFDPLTPIAPPQRALVTGRRVVGWLITFDGNPDGLSIVLREGRNTIGRDASNDICIDDQMVSSTHAFLVWRSGRARIADNSSQNGTFVNDEDVLETVEVHDNDVIRVGRTRFLIRLVDSQKVAAIWKPGT